jgi:hypothetical protein
MYPSRKYTNNFINTKKIKGGGIYESVGHSGIINPILDIGKNMVSSAVSSAKNLALSTISSTASSARNLISSTLSSLENPETQKEIQEKVGKYANFLAIILKEATPALEASRPAIEKLLLITTESIEKLGDKIGSTIVNIGLNTFQEIPGLGVLIGTFRSLDKAVQAAQAIFNTGLKLVITSSDAVKEIIEKTQEANKNISSNTQILSSQIAGTLKNKKKQILKQLSGSIEEFNDSTLNPKKFLRKEIKKRSKTSKMAKRTKQSK